LRCEIYLSSIPPKVGRYGERDRQWIRLRDPDANHYPDDGFYAI